MSAFLNVAIILALDRLLTILGFFVFVNLLFCFALHDWMDETSSSCNHLIKSFDHGHFQMTVLSRQLDSKIISNNWCVIVLLSYCSVLAIC